MNVINKYFTVYLLVGVTAMTLTLSVIYSIPEFDLSAFFLLSCGSGKSGLNGNTGTGNGSSADPERIRLHSSGSSGPMYTQHQDERSGSTLVRKKILCNSVSQPLGQWFSTFFRRRHIFWKLILGNTFSRQDILL